MKICPACERDYADDTLNFCLMCGTALLDSGSHPTVVIGAGETETRAAVPTQPAGGPVAARPRKGRALWILLGLLIVGVAVGSALFLTVRWRAGSNAVANGPHNDAKPKPTAKAANAATPRQSPTAAPSPTGDDETPSDTPDNSETSEPTPIVWSTAAMTFNGTSGRTFTFECPPDGEAAMVWGSDVYSNASSICTAAVHAGKITLEDGGTVMIEYRPGRSLYGATTRNGISSNTYGEYPGSFVFKD